MPRRNTDQKKKRFLHGIERDMSVTDATQYAGVDRTTPYTWEDSDPSFARDWAKVRDMKPRMLIDTAQDLAMEGSEFMLRFLINRYDKQAANQETASIGEISILSAEAPSDELTDDSPIADFLTIETIEAEDP